MASLLVLWDVDYTLADTDGAGRLLYQMAFAELFGGEPPAPLPSMAGRTDRAIVLELLTRAGIPDPGGQVSAFEAALAVHAPELAGLVRARGRALPGAALAIAALASLAAPPRPATARPADAAGPANVPGPANAVGLADAAELPNPSELAGTDGDRPCLVQSLLTGNIRALAEVKLGALGLTRHLDLSVGAYGDASEVRADLVPLARRRASLAYRQDFSGEGTVLVGDTPRDVEAALLTGASAIAVATGSFSMADLAAAGAHAVFPDLTDTDQVVAAILGRAPVH